MQLPPTPSLPYAQVKGTVLTCFFFADPRSIYAEQQQPLTNADMAPRGKAAGPTQPPTTGYAKHIVGPENPFGGFHGLEMDTEDKIRYKLRKIVEAVIKLKIFYDERNDEL